MLKSFIILSCAIYLLQNNNVQCCTTIVIGNQATVDGSTIAIHNADCDNCDFRLAKVPARDWPEGSTRKLLMCKADYPTVLVEGRSTTWSKENLDDIPQRDLFPYTPIAGEIPQVNHTYGLLEGYYGIINDKQVAIGETSCGAIFWTLPTFAGGYAMIDGKEITKLGLERGATAREAIEVMGSLATEYGFYGSGWTGDAYALHIEAGEAYSVVDPNEAWMFHILPDSTGTSAIWVAQRVPDNHVAVAANQFVIKEVDPENPDFMYSDNLWVQAEITGKWIPSDGLVDFTRVFGLRVDDHPHWSYSTRRMWRIFTHFKPSSNLSPYTTPWADDYPFSIEPDYLISIKNITDILRSHYEGTEFDMTKGPAAGPYGDPDRYDLSASLDGSVSETRANSGFFERSVSIYRTSQTLISQVRGFLPDSIGPRVWYGVYAPSANIYNPLYLSISEIPQPYKIGSLFQYTEESMFWLHCSVGNYVNRFRKYAIQDIQNLQEELEAAALKNAEIIDQQALMAAEDDNAVVQILTEFSNTTTLQAWKKWKDLFPQILTKYHDGYRFDFAADTVEVAPKNFFYDEDWLETAGYFDTVANDIEMLKQRGVIPGDIPSVGPDGNLLVRQQLLRYEIPLDFSQTHALQQNNNLDQPSNQDNIELKLHPAKPEPANEQKSSGGLIVFMASLSIFFSLAGFVLGRHSKRGFKVEPRNAMPTYTSIN